MLANIQQILLVLCVVLWGGLAFTFISVTIRHRYLTFKSNKIAKREAREMLEQSVKDKKLV